MHACQRKIPIFRDALGIVCTLYTGAEVALLPPLAKINVFLNFSSLFRPLWDNSIGKV